MEFQYNLLLLSKHGVENEIVSKEFKSSKASNLRNPPACNETTLDLQIEQTLQQPLPNTRAMPHTVSALTLQVQ
jgi:hypothetical protein